VGSFLSTNGYLNAAEYSNGSAIDLGTLGGNSSAAYGINDSGDIVGYSYVANNLSTDAFLYSDNVMIDINSLLPIASGWTITAAYGINDFGDIIGLGTLNGQTYAVTLAPPIGTAALSGSVPTPIPEPAPVLLIVGGLVFIGKCMWDRRRKHVMP
jgi:probable HAF family extracellular repeat protein